MKNNKTIKLNNLILTVFSFMLVWVAFPVKAQLLDKLKTTSGGAGFAEISGEGDEYIAGRISQFIQILLSFLGVIFLILMIYGGFLWMTARGNENQVTDAKKIIVNSTIGVVIVMMAYAITWFVLFSIGGAADFNLGA